MGELATAVRPQRGSPAYVVETHSRRADETKILLPLYCLLPGVKMNGDQSLQSPSQRR